MEYFIAVFFCLIGVGAIIGSCLFYQWVLRLEWRSMREYYGLSDAKAISATQYIEQFNLLLDDGVWKIINVIEENPGEFWNQVTNRQYIFPDEIEDLGMIDKKNLDKYIALLDLGSLLLIYGLVPPALYWANFEYLFNSITRCDDLSSYIAREKGLWGLKLVVKEQLLRNLKKEGDRCK